MASKKPFTDLGFRGTTWYLAEEVDRKLEAIREIAENAPGGVLKDEDTPEDFVKVDAFMRYYRAICEILRILEE